MIDKNKEKIKDGIILKSIGGLYYVKSSENIFECKARGKFRNENISPSAGDYVKFENGVITDICDRKNHLIRPPLANLDQLIFVVSTCQPVPNFTLIDKFIAIAEYKKIEPIIAVTKIDLKSEDEIRDIYCKIGIRIISADYTDSGFTENIMTLLKNKITAITGNSGAGKSTFLNHIDPELNLETSEISKKLGRGKHTTRHVELYEIFENSYIADTPGFSTFETNKYDIILKNQLSGCFREFSVFTDKCRFQDCSHTKEKGCAVIEAVQNGLIPKSRHLSYITMYEEAKQLKEWEYKTR